MVAQNDRGERACRHPEERGICFSASIRTGFLKSAARNLLFAALALIVQFVSVASAQPGGNYVKASLAGPAKAVPGKAFDLTLTLDIQSGYHIQSADAKEPYIPTKVTVTVPAGFKAGQPSFPASKTAEIAGEKIQVYEGKITVRIPITPPANGSGKQEVSAKISYQACNDQACFPPTDTTASFVLESTAPKPLPSSEVKKAAQPASTVAAKDSLPADKPAPPAASSPTPGEDLPSPGAFWQPGGKKSSTHRVTGSLKIPATQAGAFVVILNLEVAQGYHIQAADAKEPFIPTKVTVTAPDGFQIGSPKFPPATTADVAGQKLPVYEGKIQVRIPVTPLKPGADTSGIKATVSYQACDTRTCFPPDEISIPAGGIETTGQPDANPPQPSVGTVAGFSLTKIEEFIPPDRFIRFLNTGSANQESGLTNLLGRSVFLALPLIFLLGLALNLTPCVYPIIPITISYFGGQANTQGQKPIVLALFYVLGMALMYSALGVAAGLTGSLFGSQLQNPWVLGVFALIMFGLALTQFDRPNGMPIWEFQLPAGLRNKAQSRSGIAGAMLMGLMVGVVAAPCIGPAVVALLTWVGKEKSPVLGFITFFTLALGLGLPYVFLAAASGSVKKLPRSGEWMVAVKHIFGVMMIWMGVYYLQTILNNIRPNLGVILLVATTAIGGVYLAFFDRAGAQAKKFFIFKRALGVFAIGLAAWLALPPPKEAIRWQPYSDQAIAQARAEGKKVLVDFTAAWCGACKELEKYTFSDPKVGAAASEFVTIRADLTDDKSPEAQRLWKQYGIVGLPTVVRMIPDRRSASR